MKEDLRTFVGNLLDKYRPRYWVDEIVLEGLCESLGKDVEEVRSRAFFDAHYMQTKGRRD